jgi:hypothetical protein
LSGDSQKPSPAPASTSCRAPGTRTCEEAAIRTILDRSGQTTFKLERGGEIAFDLDEEFLIDGVLPKQGVGLTYGASQSFKSFAVKHMGLCVARAQPWAGRKTECAPVVYLAAEGAAGLRKRKAGYVKAGRAPPDNVDFALVPAAPNLGAVKGDYDRLLTTIEAAGIKPGLIIIDTVAKVIGGSDENGAGMAQFLVNAEALAPHFACFVLAVHHTGWNEGAKDRPRGWSGLPAALDVQILCERKEGKMSATLTIQKLKDEPAGVRFEAQMKRVILGISKTGREVSTLIVDEITDASAQTGNPKSPVRGARSDGVEAIKSALAEAYERLSNGVELSPGLDGEPVRKVEIGKLRDELRSRGLLEADDAGALTPNGRKHFHRAKTDLIGAKRFIEIEKLFWQTPHEKAVAETKS